MQDIFQVKKESRAILQGVQLLNEVLSQEIRNVTGIFRRAISSTLLK